MAPAQSDERPQKHGTGLKFAAVWPSAIASFSERIGKKRTDLRRWNGAREEKALRFYASLGRKIELLLGFDTLGDARHAKIVPSWMIERRSVVERL